MTATRTKPGIDRNLDKGRDGHRADPLSLAYQVEEHTAAVALLDVVWSRNSCGPAMVILEETAEALATLDR